jgi:hypothetical protein
MKIRNGFVSNSSSSSFIIIGVGKTGEFDEEMEKTYEKEGLETLYVESKFDYITGIVLVDNDEYIDEREISISEFNEMAQKVANILNVDISEIKLFTGTRPA